MATKSIRLQNSLTRASLAIVAVLCLYGVYTGAKWAFGNSVGLEATTPDIAEEAINFAPHDPQGHFMLAAMRERSFLPGGIAASVEGYERAASLSPDDYRMWLALGRARERAGDAEGAEKALRRAKELAPNYAQVHWALGNVLLRRGSEEEAFLEIRRAVEGNPTYAKTAAAMAWQIYDGDPTQISQKIGDSLPLKAVMVGMLAGQQRFEEAVAMWNSLPDEERRTTYKQNGAELVGALLAAKKYREALALQAQAGGTAEMVAPGKITNGGFENPVRSAEAGVFEWRIADGAQPQIGFDTNQKRSGSRSLVMIFNSTTGREFRRVQQTIIVEPGARYSLEVYYRAEIKTTGGFRWEIADDDGKALASTEAVKNNAEWTRLSAEFVAPPTETVTVQISPFACQSAICPVSGKVWFDDFDLKKIQ